MDAVQLRVLPRLRVCCLEGMLSLMMILLTPQNTVRQNLGSNSVFIRVGDAGGKSSSQWMIDPAHYLALKATAEKQTMAIPSAGRASSPALSAGSSRSRLVQSPSLSRSRGSARASPIARSMLAGGPKKPHARNQLGMHEGIVGRAIQRQSSLRSVTSASPVIKRSDSFAGSARENSPPLPIWSGAQEELSFEDHFAGLDSLHMDFASFSNIDLSDEDASIASSFNGNRISHQSVGALDDEISALLGRPSDLGMDPLELDPAFDLNAQITVLDSNEHFNFDV